MIKTKKIGFFLILNIFLTILILYSSNQYASASSVVLPDEYKFVFNGTVKSAGTEYEMKAPEVLLNVTAGDREPAGITVQWVSSERGVIELENTTYGSRFIKLVRKGPGYSTITAIISDGTNSYSISCLVKVELEFDVAKTGLTTATTTKERILVINSLEATLNTRNIYLKYVDYKPDGQPVPVSGSAISVSSVTWNSDNEGVATVDEFGKVTAVGAGSAEITATSNTMSTQDRPMSIKMRVVVKPSFSLTYDDASGNHQVEHSVDRSNEVEPAEGVPSNFVIVSNATLAENLKWKVVDVSTGNTLDPESSKLTYTVSPISGNVSFSDVKAGTYEIFAFASTKFNEKTNAPYAYMKIIVPIDIGDQNLIMTVGDTYSILENSNIPDVEIFSYSYIEGSSNIARIDQTTGIITARKNGHVRLRLVYRTEQDLYDDATVIIADIDINITVIDGIALNTTNASLYTSGTLLLQALVTDPTKTIIWSSSEPSVASVEGGLVTGLEPGITTITAQQSINGIIKKATCEITVQQSVTTITIDPEEITLAIGDYKTLLATITPKNLSGVSLRWKSSNEDIVKVVQSDALTATIQALEGGHAVISAINQDNVVVGYTHVSVQQPVTSIVLSETEVIVPLNTSRLQLRATVYPENALNKEVTWSSTDTSKATVDTNGLVTLKKSGTVSIIATSVDNPEITAVCNITIEVPVVSVALDETEKTMYVGQTARLSYLVLPANASTSTVTWTSTNNKVVSVDSTGRVTAKGVGTAVIILKTLDGGRSVYCTITVKQIATGIKLDVSKLDMMSGDYYYLKPELTPKNSTENNIAWESSDTKIVIVDNSGKVTAKDSGTAVVMARTEAGGVAFVKITVTQPVKGLLLNFSEKTIYTGEEFELKVSVSPSEASELGVTWKSSNPKIATVDEDGNVEGIMGGTAIITSTTVDGGYSATCVVTVREMITTLKLDPESYKLGLNKTVVLTATVTNPSATNQKVTWKSSNPKVASVNKNGKVTGLSYGYATITATAQDGSEAEASSEIEVVKLATRVSLDKGYLAMLVGEGRELKATLEPKSATYNKVKWTSSDDTVVIVDEDGFVTALKPGEVTVTAEAQDSSGKKAICYITVSNRVPSTGITVMDKKVVMISGEDKIVQVSLNPVTSTDDVMWSSDNSAVAKVDQKSGKIMARSTGTANVTVMTDTGKTAVIQVTVIGLNITDLELEQYTEYDLFVDGATTPVKWDISNPEVAVVRNGRVSTRATGTATITATVNGRKLQCKLKVSKIR